MCNAFYDRLRALAHQQDMSDHAYETSFAKLVELHKSVRRSSLPRNTEWDLRGRIEIERRKYYRDGRVSAEELNFIADRVIHPKLHEETNICSWTLQRYLRELVAYTLLKIARNDGRH